MNIGDKVICIKDLNLRYLKFIVNETYIISGATNYEVYVTTNINVKNSGSWMRREIENINGVPNVFNHYFISLSEWREQQMKSILDEN